jgi:hypothetical protein
MKASGDGHLEHGQWHHDEGPATERCHLQVMSVPGALGRIDRLGLGQHVRAVAGNGCTVVGIACQAQRVSKRSKRAICSRRLVRLYHAAIEIAVKVA